MVAGSELVELAPGARIDGYEAIRTTSEKLGRPSFSTMARTSRSTAARN